MPSGPVVQHLHDAVALAVPSSAGLAYEPSPGGVQRSVFSGPGACEVEHIAAAAEGTLSPWLIKLRAGDLRGPELCQDQYLRLRGEALDGNPRMSEEYKDRCCEAVGLGVAPDQERYSHLQHADEVDLLRWVVRRASGCFWIKDSPRTCVRGFRHRLITRGPPVRVGLQI